MTPRAFLSLLALFAVPAAAAPSDPVRQAGATAGADGKPGGASAAVLTLEEALVEALSRSPELARLRIEVAQAELEEPLLLANTDPRFESSYLWADDQAPRAQPAFGLRSRAERFDVGLSQSWLTGTQAGLVWRNELIRNPAPFRPLDPTADSRLVFELRQPLLRYFWGRPDKARRGRARAGVAAAREHGRAVYDRAAAEVIRAYLELYAAREGLDITRDSLAAARRLSDSYSDKKRYGLVEPSDVLQAEASVQVQETELTLAESRVEVAQNALLTLMQRQKADGKAEPLDVDFPKEWPAFAGSLDQALAAGLSGRGDVRSARAAVESAEFGLRVAALDGLPDLAVHGSYGVAGLDRRYSDAWSDLGGFDHPVKSAGVTLDVPFGRKREKLDRRAAALRLESLKRERERVEQNAIREIRDAWRNLETSRRRLEASRTLASLEERKMKAERENFGKGRSNTDLIVRFQLDLHRARQQLLRARVDEALARVELGRASGALAETLFQAARPGPGPSDGRRK